MQHHKQLSCESAAVLLACGLFTSLLSGIAAAQGLPVQVDVLPGPDILHRPELNWEQRSDWLDVTKDVAPAAVGDGVADDTAPLHAAAANDVGAPDAAPHGAAEVVFSQPDVSDIDGRLFVIERRPRGDWFMISWQKSPFTADGRFVPVDWDPGEKTGLSIPDEPTRLRTQRGMRDAAGSTVCQMIGGMVGAYLNSADLAGEGVDAQGNPLPGSHGYKQMVTPSYLFGSEETVRPWRAPGSRLQMSLNLQIPTAVCAEMKGSLAYVNPLLTLVDPNTGLKISWGPMLFSKRSRGDATRPLQQIAYDAPSRSWMIRDRLVSGAVWLELAPGSASYQTAPWLGWRQFSWTVSHAHVAAALEAMQAQEPDLAISTDPADYQLTAFHLNAETNFQTAPAELGWSMRDLQIVVTAAAVTDGERERARQGASPPPRRAPVAPTAIDPPGAVEVTRAHLGPDSAASRTTFTAEEAAHPAILGSKRLADLRWVPIPQAAPAIPDLTLLWTE